VQNEGVGSVEGKVMSGAWRKKLEWRISTQIKDSPHNTIHKKILIVKVFTEVKSKK
jgi:hypothetical protein